MNHLTPSFVDRLAQSHLSTRPVLALAVLFVLFGLAGAVAPEITNLR